MLTDCSPFRTGLADDASAELEEAHRRAFGLPLSVQEDLATLAADRPLTEDDLDAMFCAEMERRDREADATKEPEVLTGVDVAGKRFKAYVRIGGRKIQAGTHRTYAAAESAAYDVAAALRGSAA